MTSVFERTFFESAVTFAPATAPEAPEAPKAQSRRFRTALSALSLSATVVVFTPSALSASHPHVTPSAVQARADVSQSPRMTGTMLASAGFARAWFVDAPVEEPGDDPDYGF